MKNKIEYTKGEIGKVKITKDFLPRPSELALAKTETKISPQIQTPDCARQV